MQERPYFTAVRAVLCCLSFGLWLEMWAEFCLCADLGIGKDKTVEVDSEIIPLPQLNEPCIEKLIEWCTHHEHDPPPPPVVEGEEDIALFNDEIGEWDQEFLKMEDSVLFDLILVRILLLCWPRHAVGCNCAKVYLVSVVFYSVDNAYRFWCCRFAFKKSYGQ